MLPFQSGLHLRREYSLSLSLSSLFGDLSLSLSRYPPRFLSSSLLPSPPLPSFTLATPGDLDLDIDRAPLYLERTGGGDLERV